MRITCDPESNMGYIYLRPPRTKSLVNDMSTIAKHVMPGNPKIPVLEDFAINRQLRHLSVSSKTYRQALDDGDFEEEFYNDKDDEGYLTGVEFSVDKDEFISLINKQAFRIYGVNFNKSRFNFLTLDTLDNVLSGLNTIYPLNDKKDAFLIITEISRNYCSEDSKFDYRICLVKGLLWSAFDIYSIEYLRKPEFVLFE